MKDKKYYSKLAVEAARTADSKKAENITIYDVESKTGLYYYSLIMNALSSPHLKAIEEEIVTKFKREKNEYLLHRDGILSQNWKALDYGGLVIHIFASNTRDFYALDKIYSDCKKLKWEKKQIKKEKKEPKTKKAKTQKTKRKKSSK